MTQWTGNVEWITDNEEETFEDQAEDGLIK